MERRQFLRRVIQAAAAVSVGSARRVLGASERVPVGLIGCGTRGTAVARLLREVPGVTFAAVCDVYEPHAARAREWAGGDCQAYGDFRRVLDRKDVAAVVVATPDHWHAIPTVLACQAGKDVYVEKPLAHNVREGRAMVAAARKYNRVVQVGTQHRSAAHYREVARVVQGGELGKVRFVRVWNYTNLYPRGIGRAEDSRPPDGLDWDFYLGPAPAVPFNKNRFLGTFRWFWDYAGGFITDWGTHRFDSVHQVMGEDAPRSVSAAGGRFELHDGAETPDVLQATYEYPSFVLSYESCQLNAHGTGGRTPDKRYYRARGKDDRPHGEAFYGSNGTLFSDRLGFEIFPELEPSARPGSPPPGTRMKRREASGQDATDLHVKDFIDCVRSRKQPAADVEIGHRAATVAHLGNIAYRTGRKLRWEAGREEIRDDPQAAALLARAARKPWDLI
jgi:predicted dehydrogenase